MAVTNRPFGVTKEGAAVTAYTLKNAAGASAVILDYGATVQSLLVPDKTGALRDVVLGYDTVTEYEENGGYLGATIGRVGNRIGGGRFSLNGTDYALAKNDGANHLHGGLRGFDKQLWTAEPVGDASLRCSRLSPDGEEGYPGNLSVSVTFTLTEDNALQIVYEAQTDRDTPVNLTNHSYFNLNGGGDILRHRLTLRAERFCENDSGCLPTGRLLPVAGTPFDFRIPKEIGRDIGQDDPNLRAGGGYDHNFVLSGENAAVLESEESGIRMELWTDMPGTQLYTGNSLTERTGKGGSVMGYRGAVCLETQLFPDGMAHYGFPSPVLRAGQTLHSQTVYRFGLIK